MAEKINAERMFESSVGSTITESDEINRRRTFSSREVGITHPDNPSFLRVTDSGDIEIFAAPGVGIVISASTRTVSIFADNIKFNSKEDGLKWNSKEFNSSATVFTEPAFIAPNSRDFNPGFKNADYYINNIDQLSQEEDQPTVTISGDYDYLPDTDTSVVKESLLTKNQSVNPTSFTQSELNSIDSFWSQNTKVVKMFNKNEELMQFFTNYRLQGYTIEQTKSRIIEDVENV